MITLLQALHGIRDYVQHKPTCESIRSMTFRCAGCGYITATREEDRKADAACHGYCQIEKGCPRAFPCPQCGREHYWSGHGFTGSVGRACTCGLDTLLTAYGAGEGREEKCVRCRLPRSRHCDLDEPGVDHAQGCRKVHHEFKAPPPADPAPPAPTLAQVIEDAVAVWRSDAARDRLFDALSHSLPAAEGWTHSREEYEQAADEWDRAADYELAQLLCIRPRHGRDESSAVNAAFAEHCKRRASMLREAARHAPPKGATR